MSRVVSLGSRFEPESRQVDSPKPHATHGKLLVLRPSWVCEFLVSVV